MAVLINHINKPNTTIAIDGSLYRFHPKFKETITETIKMVVKPNLTV
jgi:hypothetical protein